MFNTSVDSIMRAFTTTIDKLEAHASSQRDKSEGLRTQINDLSLQRVNIQAEELRATEVAEKLRKILT